MIFFRRCCSKWSNACDVSWTQSLLLFSLQFVVDSACLFETFLRLDSTVSLCCGWSACSAGLCSLTEAVLSARSHRSEVRGSWTTSVWRWSPRYGLFVLVCVSVCVSGGRSEGRRWKRQSKAEGGRGAACKHPAGNGTHPGKYLSLLVTQRGSQSLHLALSYSQKIWGDKGWKKRERERVQWWVNGKDVIYSENVFFLPWMILSPPLYVTKNKSVLSCGIGIFFLSSLNKLKNQDKIHFHILPVKGLG